LRPPSHQLTAQPLHDGRQLGQPQSTQLQLTYKRLRLRAATGEQPRPPLHDGRQLGQPQSAQLQLAHMPPSHATSTLLPAAGHQRMLPSDTSRSSAAHARRTGPRGGRARGAFPELRRQCKALRTGIANLQLASHRWCHSQLDCRRARQPGAHIDECASRTFGTATYKRLRLRAATGEQPRPPPPRVSARSSDHHRPRLTCGGE
jgi:hypothetical protein